MATEVSPGKAPGASKYEAYVLAQLGRAKGRIRALDLAAALCGFVAATCAYAVLMILCDNRWQLSAGLRQAAFLAYLLGGGGYLWWFVLLPLRRRINPYYAARQMEHTLPGAKNSVINFLDLDREQVAPAIRGAVGQRAARDIAKADLEEAVSGRRAGWAAGSAGLFFAGFVLLFVLCGPSQFFSLLRRSFISFDLGIGITTRTRIEVVRPEGGNVTLPIGRSLTIGVRVTGRIPDPNSPQALRLLYCYQEGEPCLERPLTAETPQEWSVSMSAFDVQNGFWYKVAGGDCETEEYRVTTRSTPLLTDFKATYQYRPYTGRAPDLRRERKLEALRGTEVHLRVRTNRPVKDAAIDLTFKDTKKTIRAERLPDQPQGFQAKLLLEESGQYRIRYTSTEDEQYLDPSLFPLIALPDQPPTVELFKPGKDITLPANGLLALEGVAIDDVGVKSLNLQLQVVDGAKLRGQPYRPKDGLNLPSGGNPRKVEYKDFVDFSKVLSAEGQPHKLAAGMVLEYWLEATDACDQPKPNTGASKHYRVVLTEPEKDAAKQEQKREEARKEQEKQQANQDQNLKQEDQARQEQNERQKEEAKNEEKAAEGAKENKPENGPDGKKEGDPRSEDGKKDPKNNDPGEKGKDQGGEKNAKEDKVKEQAEKLQKAIDDQKKKEDEKKDGKNPDGKDNKDPKDGKNPDGKDNKDPKDGKNPDGNKDPKDGKNPDGKDNKDPKDGKNPDGNKDPKDGKNPDGKDNKDPKDGKNPDGNKDPKDGKNPDGKDNKDPKDGKNPDGKDNKQGNDPKGQNKDDGGAKPGEQKGDGKPEQKPGKGDAKDQGGKKDDKQNTGGQKGDKGEDKPGGKPGDQGQKGEGKQPGKPSGMKDDKGAGKDTKPMQGDGGQPGKDKGEGKPEPQPGKGDAKDAKGEGKDPKDSKDPQAGKPAGQEKGAGKEQPGGKPGQDNKADGKDGGDKGAKADNQPQGQPKDRPAPGDKGDGKGDSMAGKDNKADPKNGGKNSDGGKPKAGEEKPTGEKGEQNVAKGQPKGDEKADAKERRNELAKETEELAKLKRDLKSDDPAKREQAARRLEKMAEKADNPEVREQARRELEKDGRPVPKDAKADNDKPKNGGEGPGEKPEPVAQAKPSDAAKDKKPGDPKPGEGAKESKPGEGKNGENGAEGQGMAKNKGKPQAGKEPGDNGQPGDDSNATAKGKPGDGDKKTSGDPGPGGKPGDGTSNEETPAVRNEKGRFQDKAGVLQLDDFKNKVDKKILEDAKMTEAEFREFLKAYAEMLKRKQADGAIKDNVVAPKKGGAISSIGAQRVKPGTSQNPSDVKSSGRPLPPPGYRDAYKEFTRQLANPDEK